MSQGWDEIASAVWSSRCWKGGGAGWGERRVSPIEGMAATSLHPALLSVPFLFCSCIPKWHPLPLLP